MKPAFTKISVTAENHTKLLEITRWIGAAPAWLHLTDSFYEYTYELSMDLLPIKGGENWFVSSVEEVEGKLIAVCWDDDADGDELEFRLDIVIA